MSMSHNVLLKRKLSLGKWNSVCSTKANDGHCRELPAGRWKCSCTGGPETVHVRANSSAESTSQRQNEICPRKTLQIEKL